MLEDRAKAVARALSLGFILDAPAFELLSELPPEVDGTELVEKVVAKKKAEPTPPETRITRTDLEELVPPQFVSRKDRSSAVILDLEPAAEVVMDPTHSISPVKAGEGYKRLFQDRYERLLSIMQKRPDMRGLVTVKSARGVSSGQTKRVAGLLLNKSSKRGSTELTIEDPSGTIRVTCSENSAKSALRLPLDSLVAVEVSRSKAGQLFANSLTLPDVPDRRPVNSGHEAYAILLSDLHVGSRMFLEGDFQRFLMWLNGELGDENIVGHVRYVVIAGDLVDGVGVYPNQEAQLAEKDSRKQYFLATKLLERIPRHIQILVSPGNHDAVRQALPQPAVSVEVAQDLYKLENVKVVGNPSYLKLHGVGVLVYHGKSLDDIITMVPDLTYGRPAAAMELLLRTRHLAPVYGKRTAISPELRDMLVIDTVPEIMHSGHVHTFDVSNYRGTLLINSGTWQAQTTFQANMGLEPTPSIIPIVNLADLRVVRRNFGREDFLGAS